ncbi:hypothetical protein Cni_G18863 [Canna indica]|uniref:Mitochondrial substrate carrier family protein n=1 Tax=Canna indica TaxID=4628 RepID=A0AAQ3QGF8_9LILI|nr:hypothetical protein Cni_G18863 [Canna indica]
MASYHGHPKNEKSSIRYQWIPLDVQSFEPNTNFSQKDAPKVCANDSVKSESKDPTQGVSTTKFVSAVARVWQYVGRPVDFHDDDESLKIHHDVCGEENVICYSDQRRHKPTPVRSDHLSNELQSRRLSSSTVRSNFEELKCIKNKLIFSDYNKYLGNSFIWKDVLVNGSYLHKGKDKAEWITTPTAQANACKTEKSILEDKKYATSNRFIETDEKAPAETSAKEGYDSSVKSMDPLGKDLQIPGSFYSAYSLTPMTIRKGIIVGYNPHFNYDFNFLTLVDCTNGQCQAAPPVTSSSVAEISQEISMSKEDNMHKNNKCLSKELFLQQQHLPNHCFMVQDKLQKVLVQNRHAIAGALAGTMVSLCLHPIDTIKTIIQAGGISQKSVYCTLRAIISEKGISGLYRGVATNIASSAPISAIYTFTYESVKGGLLPILPKEYHSVAHCFAGGCSSIATSFVFTPSERIKQQMQVGSQYQNCWNAFIGCLEKGGLASFYAGWTAVLCRNIPHSIIKFYTYESLKQLLLTSAKPDTSLNTLQTLLCGGIAGSTAAFFTTPFDVIKTKLQTQAPGTLGKYNGVFHALREIAREEGLQGLYRGLTPRLAMYISQGAIFFASYEFLKAVFALEVPQSPVRSIHDKQNADSSTSLEMNKLHS